MCVVSRLPFRWVGRLAAALAVAAAVYLGLVAEPGRYPAAAHLCWMVFGALALVELARRRFRTAGAYILGLLVVVGLLACVVTVADDIKTVPTRLILYDAPQNEPSSMIGVFWSSSSDGGAIDTPWNVSPATDGAAEFRSEARLWVAEHTGYFVSYQAWQPDLTDTILVVAGGRRFRFSPDSAFGSGGRGRPPDELSATLDIGEYLRGAKRPPAVEWPEN